MRLSTILSSIAVAAFVSTGAFAQTAQPQTPAQTAPAKPAAKSKAPQSAASKACSAQADAKGLHGKERKKFRSACIKNGGKAT